MSDIQTSAAPAAPEAAVIANTTPEAPVSISDTMAEVYEKHYPNERVARADSGKFQSKTPTESFSESKDTGLYKSKAEGAEAAEPADEINQEPVAEAAETVAVEPPKPSSKPRPQSWSAELDQWWSELPPERQDFLLKRETEAHQKITQLGTKATAAEKYAAIIDRHRQIIGQNNPELEIENLLQTKAALLRDPQGSIKWLADQLGVDLSRFAQAQIGGEQPAENDQIRSLSQQVALLQRQLGETHQRLTAREQHEMQSREQSLANTVADFAKDKDYWPDIESEVLAQVYALKAKHPDKDPKEVLKEAHDRAVKLNDEVSAKLNKAKRDKEAADKAAEEKRKADAAKKLASLNPKSSSGNSPKAAFKSFEAEMADVYDKVARG